MGASTLTDAINDIDRGSCLLAVHFQLSENTFQHLKLASTCKSHAHTKESHDCEHKAGPILYRSVSDSIGQSYLAAAQSTVSVVSHVTQQRQVINKRACCATILWAIVDDCGSNYRPAFAAHVMPCPHLNNRLMKFSTRKY